MIKHVLVVGVLSLSSMMAWGWGAVGHKTSAKVAWALMDKATQAQVLEMLNGGDIADASIWPDAARGNAEWKFSIWYHFEKAPDNYTYLDNLKRQEPGLRQLGGLVEALYVAEDTIKNPSATKEDKAIALKFVIHCIGDIHQPLHTGRVEDKSGNQIPMKWLGADTNLHAVWDSQIIYFGRKDVLTPNSDLTADPNNDSTLNYANFLLTKYKDFKPDASTFARYDDWMHESMVPRSDAYDFKNLSEQDYTNKFMDTVDQRVFLAGVRIAFVLRRLVNQEPSTEPLETLRRAITSIVGDFTKFVSLKPRFTAAPGNPKPIPPPEPIVITPQPVDPNAVPITIPDPNVPATNS